MEINARNEKGAQIIAVKGRMDAVTAPEFDKSMAELMAGEAVLFLLDLSDLEYISSAGLRSILAAAKQAKAKNGEIIFSGLKGPVKDVFDISGFGSIFKIFSTEEEALAGR